jgi:hypothetical protein
MKTATQTIVSRETSRGTEYLIGGYWCDDRNTCQCCLELRLSAGLTPRESSPQQSGGIYAGRMCDECFNRQYIPDWRFDPCDAGESYDEV